MVTELSLLVVITHHLKLPAKSHIQYLIQNNTKSYQSIVKYIMFIIHKEKF